MNKSPMNIPYFGVIGALFLLLSASYLLRPIMEPDFFWHLKTGEWIWQHRVLPKVDPFSFAGPQDPSGRQLVILQGYWLAQVVYHLINEIMGLWGFYVLRLVMLGAFFVLFLRNFEHNGVGRLYGLALLSIFSIFFLENYALERPQVFTFFFFALLLLHYRRVREKPDRTYPRTAIPALLLTAVWSNLHGGILLGQAVILLMLFIESIVFVFEKNIQKFKSMGLFCIAAMAGTFLRPVQISFKETGTLSNPLILATQSNYEYFSVYKWLFIHDNYKLSLAILISALSLLYIHKAIQNRFYLETILLFIFWFFAYKHVRYLPIAMVFSLLFIGWNYYEFGLGKFLTVGTLAMSILSVGLWTENDFKYFTQTPREGLVDKRLMPVEAADFLEKNHYSGRVFNSYNWGGYLIWRCYPDIQVFIDGRTLNEEALGEYYQALRSAPSLQPPWKNVVDKYDINIALLPLAMGSQIDGLISEFARNHEWSLVYRDSVSVVFVRTGPNRRSAYQGKEA